MYIVRGKEYSGAIDHTNAYEASGSGELKSTSDAAHDGTLMQVSSAAAYRGAWGTAVAFVGGSNDDQRLATSCSGAATVLPLFLEITCFAFQKSNASTYLNGIFTKFTLGTLASVATVAAMVFGLISFMWWPRCDRSQEVLATQSVGRSIVSCFEACTGLGTDLSESIELKLASGKRKTILRYGPSGGVVGCKGKTFPPEQQPLVDWSDPKLIHISIGVVYDIDEKHDAVEGVPVKYDIGRVFAKDCGFRE
jgi:hypothetical protein